jgi:hypothetical protein
MTDEEEPLWLERKQVTIMEDVMGGGDVVAAVSAERSRQNKCRDRL